jgi:MtrB/PioB family decaheme-associated outer membrane protein
VSTNVRGVGTNSLALPTVFRSTTSAEMDLKLQRSATAISASKLFSDAFRVNLSFKSEDKKGAIISSSYGGTWNNPLGTGKNYSAFYFAPQPENYRHNQFEASFDYFTKALQLTGGYYGSFFSNATNALNITPGQNSIALTAGPITIPWISLAPDNKSQQYYLSGAYNFTNATRGTFKVSKTRDTQDDGFIPAYGSITTAATYGAINPPGVPYASGITNSSLGAVVDTTSYFGQLTSKLTRDLDGTASWRYEDRKDKTPQRFYLDSSASAEFPRGATNEHESHTVNRGKFELSYRLPEGYRLTGGLDYESKKTPEAWRDSVKETTYRVDLRKALGETVSGSVLLAHGNRTGGTWHLENGAPTVGVQTFSTATGVAAPLQFVDRKRDKVKFMLDWTPTEPLSTQLFYEYANDKYPFSPVSFNPGARMGQTDGKAQLYGLDLSYKIDRDWTARGYASYNENKTHQNELYTPRSAVVTAGGVLDQNCTGTAVTNSCVPWTADLKLKGLTAGVGAKGTKGKWDIGVDYLYSKDTTTYGITFDPLLNGAGNSVPAGAGVLPDTNYTLNRFRVNGVFHYTKETRVRLDYIYDHRKMDDYTWANWTFTDGTRVNVSPNQTTHVFGVTLIQSF